MKKQKLHFGVKANGVLFVKTAVFGCKNGLTSGLPVMMHLDKLAMGSMAVANIHFLL